MKQLLKYGQLGLLVSLIVFGGWAWKTEAAISDSRPIILIYRVTDVLTQRVTDIIYYLVMQKRYIFENFTDPNTYTAWEVPPGFDQVLNVLIATSSKLEQPKISGKPIAVTTSTVPTVKKVESESLDDSEILTLTNKERKKESLNSLTDNSLLDLVASLRAEDLFTNQYFEHESPDGKAAPVLAKKVGYNYVLIGENLALGNFEGDQGIIEAWMDSPGHRANILNAQYKELGVAKQEGLYKGQKMTIAVQIFADSGGTCQKPNAQTKILIDSSSSSIKQMQVQAQNMYADLDKLKINPATEQSYYNQKIQEYNYFAKKINDAVLSLKNLVDIYNLEVGSYNSCL